MDAVSIPKYHLVSAPTAPHSIPKSPPFGAGAAVTKEKDNWMHEDIIWFLEGCAGREESLQNIMVMVMEKHQ